jgi:hypothetical protein
MANRQQSVQFFNPNKPSFQESLRMKRVPIIAIAIFGTLPLIAYTGAARAYRSSQPQIKNYHQNYDRIYSGRLARAYHPLNWKVILEHLYQP